MKKAYPYMLLFALVGAGCGGGGSGGGSGSATVTLALSSPNSQASPSSKSLSSSQVPGISKSLSSINVTSCTVTATTGSSTISQVATVTNRTATVTFTGLTDGASYVFCAACDDASVSVNDVPVGYNGCSDSSTISGNTTVSLQTLYLNLAANSGGTVIKYCRVSQNTGTLAQLECAFDGTLTDAQKMISACHFEIDPTGTRTTPAIIGTTTSEGFSSTPDASATQELYIGMGPGVGIPSCLQYNVVGGALAPQLRMRGQWTTDSDGDTLLRCNLGATQLQQLISASKTGRFAGVCTTAGICTPGSPGCWTAAPSTGMADFDVADAGDEGGANSIFSLIADGGSCNLFGTGLFACTSGSCVTSNVCIPVTPVSYTTSNSNVTTYATGAGLNTPSGTCINPNGNTLYVVDRGNDVIRSVNTTTGAMSLFAGQVGVSGSTNGNALTAALFDSPVSCTVDIVGHWLYVVDQGNGTIRRINLQVAGNAVDNLFPNGTFDTPIAFIVDHGERYFYVNQDNPGQELIQISTDDLSGSVLATGMPPYGMVIDNTDSYIYMAGLTTLVRVSTVDGSASLYANAGFTDVTALAIDPTGSYLYTSEVNDVIRKVTVTTGTPTVTLIAGQAGVSGSANGIGTAATFNGPIVTSMSPDGTVIYDIDQGANTVRKITAQ